MSSFLPMFGFMVWFQKLSLILKECVHLHESALKTITLVERTFWLIFACLIYIPNTPDNISPLERAPS